MLRLSLAARITLIVLVGMTAVWIVAIAAFYRSHANDIENSRPATQRIAALADLLETAPEHERPLILRTAQSAWFQPALFRAGTALPIAPRRAASADVYRPYADALGGRPLEMGLRSPPSFLRRWQRLLAPAAAGLEFRIALRTGDTLVIDARGPVVFNRFGVPVGFGAGLFGTLVAILALVIMHRETKPLARLAEAVDKVDLSPTPIPLPKARRSAPEIQAVVAAFHRLQDRLAGMVRSRMALIGGISHDVRTFAARLRLRVERIPDEQERTRAVADIDDMIRMLDDALLSSRAGAGELAEEMLEFAPLVQAEVDDRRAHGAAIALTVDPTAAGTIVLADRVALRRIVANVVDNALKYGRTATLHLAVHGDRLVLTVDDQGAGIPPGQRDVMLEPFSRMETSRNRGTGGAGLGLAVVRTLVEAHGGSVTIGDAPTGGCRVTLTLPRFTPA